MKATHAPPPPLTEEALRQSLRTLEVLAGPLVLLDAQARVLTLGTVDEIEQYLADEVARNEVGREG